VRFGAEGHLPAVGHRAAPPLPAAIDAVRAHLEGFSLSKGTIRFTPDHPVPDDVLEQVVQVRLAEITG
jgi:uncharacterized protein YdhG (YjbR/CyaY superfamily)